MIGKKIIPNNNGDINKNLNTPGPGVTHKINQAQPDKKDAPEQKDVVPSDDEQNIEKKTDNIAPDEAKDKNSDINNEENDKISSEKLTSIIIELFGNKELLRIKNDNIYQVPFTTEDSNIDDWTGNALRMLFKPEEIESLLAHIQTWKKQKSDALLKLQEEVDKQNKSLLMQKELVKRAEDQFIDADADRIQLKKQLKTTIDAGLIIDLFINNDLYESGRIKELLKEELLTPSSGYTDFVIKFLTAWRTLNEALNKIPEGDVEAMEYINRSLRDFLESISDTTIPQRRPLLDVIAEMCSSKSNIYSFVSPEHSLQVDPKLHAATALGGSKIKEGISFAVVKKDTFQTVKYAEVKVF